MTLPEIFRDHLHHNRSRDPFTVDDLAWIARNITGRPCSTVQARQAIEQGVMEGWAEADGDGWAWREVEAVGERQRGLFA